MLTAIVALASFAAGWWVCNRLKDRRAERAEALLRLAQAKKQTTSIR